tara:strand:+ start:1818 stop:3044 length:1227 start_codon:yes stop_codon:yes gene_type:complete
MIDVLKSLIKQFMPFAQQQMGFERPPKLFLRQDEQNAANPMGKTGFYDPENESVTLYITGRHPKDIMRSLAHELMHHTQKCNGEFENTKNMGEEGYAQADPHMRTMEIQAYQASIVFRDWEDSTKGTIYYEHLQKGDKSSMSTKDWKNGELKSLLSEAWGFKMDLSKLNNEKTHKKVLNENKDEIFAPNHYCVHHGGVHYNGSIHMAEAVKHNYNEELGRVTHYDMKLSDGTILENVAAENIQVTNASLAESHGGDMPGKRDDKKKKKKVKGKYDDGDGKDEKCDHVPCKGQEDTKGQGETLEEMGCPSDDHGGEDSTVMTVVDGDKVGVTDAEDAGGMANELLALAQKIADMLGQGSSDEEGPDLEERRARGRDREGMEPDSRRRPMKEAELREMVKKMIKEKIKRN